MKKLLLCFVLIQTSLNCYSQINFEKGYYYNNDNVKKDCFIRNIDWLNNPTEFEYKLTEKGEIKTEKLNSVSEFGVSGTIYKRFSVEIDRSTNILNELGYSRNPEYVKETLFLKQIVKGNLNLYRYVDGNLTTFFYNGKDKGITQLVYKKYLKSKSIIAESNIYKQELVNHLKCQDIAARDINQLRYSQRYLSKLFIKYNTCKGIIYANNTFEKKRENVFNANLRGGINFNNFKIPSRSSSNPSPYEFDFGTVLGFQIGVETEFILPFNKNKWAIIVEPSYNHFKSESTSLNYFPETVTLSYSTFELPVGIRNYFFINDTSKIFINASYVLIFDVDSEFTTVRPGFDFKKGTNMSFGVGYNYKKLSVEARFDTDRGELFPDSNNFRTEFTSFSLILGMNVF